MRDHKFKSQSDPKSPLLGVRLFLVQLFTVPVSHTWDVNKAKKVFFSSTQFLKISDAIPFHIKIGMDTNAIALQPKLKELP